MPILPINANSTLVPIHNFTIALFPKSKAERRLAPSTVKISLLLCGRYLKREEVAGQVKVGLKFFYKVQKLAIISLGTVTDL